MELRAAKQVIYVKSLKYIEEYSYLFRNLSLINKDNSDDSGNYWVATSDDYDVYLIVDKNGA